MQNANVDLLCSRPKLLKVFFFNLIQLLGKELKDKKKKQGKAKVADKNREMLKEKVTRGEFLDLDLFYPFKCILPVL